MLPRHKISVSSDVLVEPGHADKLPVMLTGSCSYWYDQCEGGGNTNQVPGKASPIPIAYTLAHQCTTCENSDSLAGANGLIENLHMYPTVYPTIHYLIWQTMT